MAKTKIDEMALATVEAEQEEMAMNVPLPDCCAEEDDKMCDGMLCEIQNFPRTKFNGMSGVISGYRQDGWIFVTLENGSVGAFAPAHIKMFE